MEDFMEFQKMYTNCELCPRKCNVNRQAGKLGVCGVDNQLKLARAALHYWEEPCISGTRGSGAVFFSGCSLHCVFCQNEKIAQGLVGKCVPDERLAEIFLELQEKGANNINLVTPGQYVPHIIQSVEKARNQGLRLPIIYNTSSYECVDTIKSLEGIVDVYLPDFKYMDSRLSAKYSHAPDYPKVAKAAIAEMVRQQPAAYFYPESVKLEVKQGTSANLITTDDVWVNEAEDGYLIGKGVIVRQLLLPGMLADAMAIVKYLYHTYGKQIYISMMSQYTPLEHVEDYPELNQKVTAEEYETYVNYAIRIGVAHGFIQEGEVAEESFIPEFNCEGV